MPNRPTYRRPPLGPEEWALCLIAAMLSLVALWELCAWALGAR